MPATQHDAWVWVAGGDRTAVFDNARAVLAALRGVATVGHEVTGWLYRHDRDLTGFIDGTENPSLLTAAEVATVPAGEPGAGASVVLYQRVAARQRDLGVAGQVGQEMSMGRTKADSVELPEDVMLPSAHVARTTVERDGEEQQIFRRNVAYGGVTDHGTAFVGFAQDRWRLARDAAPDGRGEGRRPRRADRVPDPGDRGELHAPTVRGAGAVRAAEPGSAPSRAGQRGCTAAPCRTRSSSRSTGPGRPTW